MRTMSNNSLPLGTTRIHIGRLDPPVLPPVSELKIQPDPLAPNPHPELPFENLVFEGGGAKGTAYCGAIEVLEEVGLYPNHIRRVAGTSSGSFVATMLSVGCSSGELKDLLYTTDMSQLVQDARWGKIGAFMNMIREFGFNPGTRLLSFLGDRLEERTGSADVTFAQILQRTGRELCVPVTNISRMCTEYCHPKTTPDMPVRLAVGMSMSLPVLMQPYRLVREIGDPPLGEEDLYTDGGLLCNYPLNAFDGWWLSLARQDSFLQRLRPLSAIADHNFRGVRFTPRNPQTLGFTVFDMMEHDLSREWAGELGGPPPRPSTLLAKLKTQREKIEADRAAQAAALERSFQRLLNALAEVEEDGDGRVSHAECDRIFASGTLSDEDAQHLFGTTDAAAIFNLLDDNDDGFISYDEIMKFMDARNIDLTARARGTGRCESKRFTNFMSNVFHTMLIHIRKTSLHPDDQWRTVPIDTDYIGTADFALQDGDRAFLLQCGRTATLNFLEQCKLRTS